MRSIHMFAATALFASGLYGQKFQNYCFDHPTAVICNGHDTAVKRQRPPAPEAPSPVSVSRPFASQPVTRGGNAQLLSVGGIDWHFADPNADLVMGFNFEALANSPLTRMMISQLVAQKGLSDPTLQKISVQKILDRLADAEQVGISLHNGKVIVMLTGPVAEQALTAPEPGLKTVPLNNGTILMGHAEAVDWAVQRIHWKGQLSGLAQFAEQRQASAELWAVGGPSAAGPDGMRAGIRQIALMVWVRDRLTCDMAVEFSAPPPPALFQSTLAAASIEGNTAHMRLSMDANEIQQKFSQIASGPLGPSLSAMIDAARYLPARETQAVQHKKPVIFGLDDGPREVK